MSFTTRMVGSGVVGLFLAGTIATPVLGTPTPTPPAQATPAQATPTAASPGGSSDVTSPQEAQRVDAVPTPALEWYWCSRRTQCATAQLPLDYDEPAGPTVEIAVVRLKARDPASRIGSLFVNPGGPGGSGTEMAMAAPGFLSDSVLDRFDIVGFDPRGVGSSDSLTCFPSAREQTIRLSRMSVFFPYGAEQEKGYVKASEGIGRNCSHTGAALAGAMSTAEVARDMDVLRRAVGDPTLTFLGFSYGSALGQYYANMFPDRVRALALDGVVDPVSWTGVAVPQASLQDDRLGSADAAYRALKELLARCDAAGARRCSFAAGNPLKRFDAITRTLRAKPLVLGRSETHGVIQLTYADFVGLTLMSLYSPDAGEDVTGLASEVQAMLSPHPRGAVRQRAAAQRALLQRLSQVRKAGRDFAYDHSLETFAGVLCTDATHPDAAAQWSALTAAADRRAPYFGRAWSWQSAPCARNTWTVRDEDAYHGPFNRRTGAPVLFVGNYWDPATSYTEAVSATRLLPNSRLLSSDNWGHTAYGTSACVTLAVDGYLLRGTLPTVGTKCRSKAQPFTVRGGMKSVGVARSSATDGRKRLPPVVAPHPAAAYLSGSTSAGRSLAAR